jgi:hypothetical protein
MLLKLYTSCFLEAICNQITFWKKISKSVSFFVLPFKGYFAIFFIQWDFIHDINNILTFVAFVQ